MKNYLLLIKGSFAEWNSIDQSKREEIYQEFGKFASYLGEKGYLRGGDGCSDKSFRILNRDMKDSECVVPLETKDMVTGYFTIEVPTEEEALAIARKCPAFDCGEYVELIFCSD